MNINDNFEIKENKYNRPCKAYLTDIKDFKLLSKEREIELFKKLKSGDNSARDEIIMANVRLVISIAKKFRCKFLFFEDLISVGNIGLIKAIDKFDSTRGCRFTTYAYNWIWQAINREVMNKSREISIPCHEQEKIMSRLKKLNKTKFYSYYAYEREVKPVTISINSIYRHFEDNDIKVEDLISGIIDDNDVNSDIDNRSLVDDLLKNLTKLERNILKRRYGILGYGKIDTLKDIGTDYALSRERIRQLQSIAIKKIKEAANHGNEAS